MSASHSHSREFYVGGAWISPRSSDTQAVENPATSEVCTTVALGGREDVDLAVGAARKAFTAFAASPKQERVALLQRILGGIRKRSEELARVMTQEMGAPIGLSRDGQVAAADEVLKITIESLEQFEFALQRGSTRIFKEPAGVCVLITPWNWPLLQIVTKVAPALAAGCTVVLKPSELAPTNALLFAEIAHEAGVPPGAFNLVGGTGTLVGPALVSHPQVDAVSFTGSTRGGIAVAREAAGTVKRVNLELGGKSANIILDDADLDSAVREGVAQCFANSGQNCNAPSRLLVPARDLARAVEVARAAAQALVVGDPWEPGTVIGPLANKPQYERVQQMIGQGLVDGAQLVAGGAGRPAGIERGYYARPTVFSHVQPHMTIAREEIFGPVLAIMSYRGDDEAVEIANDSIYGLAANVSSGDVERARRVAAKLRVGRVVINYAPWDPTAPFGGFKQSGYGREYGDFGIAEFVETKSVLGFGP